QRCASVEHERLRDLFRIDACIEIAQRGGQALEILTARGRGDVKIERGAWEPLEARGGRTDEYEIDAVFRERPEDLFGIDGCHDSALLSHAAPRTRTARSSSALP